MGSRRRRRGFSRCAAARTGCNSCSICRWSPNRALDSPIAAEILTCSRRSFHRSRAQMHWHLPGGSFLNHSGFETSRGPQTRAGTLMAGEIFKCARATWPSWGNCSSRADAGASVRSCLRSGFEPRRVLTLHAPQTAITTATRGGSKARTFPGCLKPSGAAANASTSGRQKISSSSSPAVNSSLAILRNSF